MLLDFKSCLSPRFAWVYSGGLRHERIRSLHSASPVALFGAFGGAIDSHSTVTD
jgi:hypothetical protein